LIVFAASVAFPVLVVLAFSASLNVRATGGSLFPNFGAVGGPSSGNVSQITLITINMTSIQNGSFPNLLPVSVPTGFLALVILVVLVAVSLSIVANYRRENTLTTSGFESDAWLEEKRNEVAQALDRAVSSLKQGSEYRQTVLECYRQICEILEARSKVDGTSLTPREFSSTVVARLKLNSPYLPQITEIFEVARYSSHEISQADADIAIDCLSNLSAALRDAGSPAKKS
jgi:hypothetical protein